MVQMASPGNQMVKPVLGQGVEDVLQGSVERVGQMYVTKHLVELAGMLAAFLPLDDWSAMGGSTCPTARW